MEEKDISCMKDVKDVTYYGTNSGCIQIKVHSGKVLSINPASGQRIITTSSDGSIKILDNSLKVMNTLEGHQKDVWKAIEIGEKIYSVGADNTLKIWKKSDGNYKVEETIEIQGNPKDIKKLNDDEIVVKVEKELFPKLINLKTKEQKTLNEYIGPKSLDDSIFYVNDKLVLVGANSLHLIDPKTLEVIFKYDNKENKIWKTTCKENMLYTIQYNYNNSDSEIKELEIFKIENNKIIKISGNDYSKKIFDLLEIGMKNKDINDLKKEINSFEKNKTYELIAPNKGTLITTDEDFKFFASNINNNSKLTFELLYKATKDGEQASVFHSNCDEKGPTITVVKVLNGSKCGGFTPVSWKKDGCWTKDPSLRSFLCNLNNKTKFGLRQNYNHALDFHDSKLSCFGGYALQLTDKNLSNKNGICQATDYEIQSPSDLIGINEQNFQAEEIEVFLVKESN